MYLSLSLYIYIYIHKYYTRITEGRQRHQEAGARAGFGCGRRGPAGHLQILETGNGGETRRGFEVCGEAARVRSLRRRGWRRAERGVVSGGEGGSSARGHGLTDCGGDLERRLIRALVPEPLDAVVVVLHLAGRARDRHIEPRIASIFAARRRLRRSSPRYDLHPTGLTCPTFPPGLMRNAPVKTTITEISSHKQIRVLPTPGCNNHQWLDAVARTHTVNACVFVHATESLVDVGGSGEADNLLTGSAQRVIPEGRSDYTDAAA